LFLFFNFVECIHKTFVIFSLILVIFTDHIFDIYPYFADDIDFFV